MEDMAFEYRGHSVSLGVGSTDLKLFHRANDVARPTLRIDDHIVPYGQLPDGQFFLREFAYEWSYSIHTLATAYIDSIEDGGLSPDANGTSGENGDRE